MAKIAAVKGTRDFYPEEMRVRNWLFERWRRASWRNGFVEYDGPIFEHLQLYTQKSGEEITGQLFSLTDRGGRDLAIRPEITPTLARMVNQQFQSLTRPIKWFSIPRLCRAERPQRGRLREFFQWNIDIIGSDAVLADAECIYTAIDFLRSVGLTARDVEVRISSRSMLAALLTAQGFAAKHLDSVYALLDKRAKMPKEAFAALVAEQVPDEPLRDKLMQIHGLPSLEAVDSLAITATAKRALAELRELFRFLQVMEVEDYCRFDIGIVRGLAYYTGPVFEIYDRSAPLRALCGGGRYDNLLASLGGPQVAATGLGMGDVVLELALAERDLLGSENNGLDTYVIAMDETLIDQALQVVSRLRRQGWVTGLSYKQTSLSKQLKQASLQQAGVVVILGAETTDRGEVTIRDMTEGKQASVGLATLLAIPEKVEGKGLYETVGQAL